MQKTSFSNHVLAFRDEAFMLLRFHLAFSRISQLHNIKRIGRSDFVDQLISLKAIENDMVIRICKFDDNTKGVHSFKKAINEIPINHPNKIEIIEKVKKFSLSIKNLKEHRRHKQLAHLTIGESDTEFEIKYNFCQILHLIIEIIDLMHKSEIKYTWKDGSHEIFNLKEELHKTAANN